ncbi:MAG TPA: hypothetical protein PKB15_03525 [Acidimicrobiia bacterium]|nr:hypothetical protein [Acidimicrobiia bacterium]
MKYSPYVLERYKTISEKMERFDAFVGDQKNLLGTGNAVVADMRKTLASIFGLRQDADPITPGQAEIIVDVISFHLLQQEFLEKTIGKDGSQVSHAPISRGPFSPLVMQGWIRVMSSLCDGRDITVDLALHTEHFFRVHGPAVFKAYPGKSGVLQFADVTSDSILWPYAGVLAAQLLIKEYEEYEVDPTQNSNEGFSFSLFTGRDDHIFSMAGRAEKFVRALEEIISPPDSSCAQHKNVFALFRHLGLANRIYGLCESYEDFNAALNRDDVRLTDAIPMLSRTSALEILDRDIETLFPGDAQWARAGLHAVLKKITEAPDLNMDLFGEVLTGQIPYTMDDRSPLSELAETNFIGKRNAPIKRQLCKAMGSGDVNDFLFTLKREFPHTDERTRAIELIAAMCRPYREGMDPIRHREFMLDARDATCPVVARGVSVSL